MSPRPIWNPSLSKAVSVQIRLKGGVCVAAFLRSLIKGPVNPHHHHHRRRRSNVIFTGYDPSRRTRSNLRGCFFMQSRRTTFCRSARRPQLQKAKNLIFIKDAGSYWRPNLAEIFSSPPEQKMNSSSSDAATSLFTDRL